MMANVIFSQEMVAGQPKGESRALPTGEWKDRKIITAC